MKKLFLLIIFFISIVTGVSAQTERGNFVLNGDVGYIHNKNYSEEQPRVNDYFEWLGQKNTNVELTLRPSIGYLIGNNLELGLAPGYFSRSHNSEATYIAYGQEYKSFWKNLSKEYSFSAYIKKYLFLTDRIAFTGQASVGYFKETRKIDFQNVDIVDLNENIINVSRNSYYTSRFTGYSASLIPGIAFFISDNINLKATFGRLGFSRSQNRLYNEQETNNKTNFLGLHFGPEQFTLGLSYFIRR